MNNTQTVNEYVPDYFVTPGEVLEDYLENSGLSQASLSNRTGLSKKTINEIIKAKSAITAETALKFERTLGRPAHFWSNLERQYQEDKIRLQDKTKLEKDLCWLNVFPLNEMKKLGWIEKPKDKILQLDELLRFFAIASVQQWDTIWVEELQAAFRKTNNTKKNDAIISAWLRQGEIEASKINCQKFEKQKLLEKLDEIRSLVTVTDAKSFEPKLKEIFASAGVAVVFVPALPKLGIYGAVRRYNDKVIMQLSLYGKSHDLLWFTIFHEICHLLKHSTKTLFIEGLNLNNDHEKEADKFAQDILIPPKDLDFFLSSCFQKPTLTQIIQFAKRINTNPGIVVGRLQHDKIIPMDRGNDLKPRYRWARE
jgi:addiction module HigA family antidote